MRRRGAEQGCPSWRGCRRQRWVSYGVQAQSYFASRSSPVASFRYIRPATPFAMRRAHHSPSSRQCLAPFHGAFGKQPAGFSRWRGWREMLGDPKVAIATIVPAPLGAKAPSCLHVYGSTLKGAEDAVVIIELAFSMPGRPTLRRAWLRSVSPGRARREGWPVDRDRGHRTVQPRLVGLSWCALAA